MSGSHTLVTPAALLLASLAFATACSPSAPAGPPAPGALIAAGSAATTFAVIGDYGTDDAHERAVARLVSSWDPAYIIATGDDYYEEAGGSGSGRYDESTGAYYGRWLKDVTTMGRRRSGSLAVRNAFFPVLGNHDYSDATPSPVTYTDYFTLPGDGFANSSGNERYYEFVQGPVHFFALNSNRDERDGTSMVSTQARWLKDRLAASTSAWNVVYDHHAPYSSDGTHGSITYMRWPFADWGADVVISGHAHVYERIERDGIAYFVNGLGGAQRYEFGSRVTGSKVRFNRTWGAQRVVATATSLEFMFISTGGAVIDRHRIEAVAP